MVREFRQTLQMFIGGSHEMCLEKCIFHPKSLIFIRKLSLFCGLFKKNVSMKIKHISVKRKNKIQVIIL